jgi:quercetin dioxygenase-like cupin family protein
MRKLLIATAFGLLALVGAWPAAAQHHISCRPVVERTSDIGCWIIARATLSLPQQPLYWHLDNYASRAAAEAAMAPASTVIEALGKIWLLTIADAEWRAPAGERVAKVGPFSLARAEQHVAVYMETMLPPGFAAPIHRHPGPEAVFAIEGEVCIETPAGMKVERPGGPSHLVPAGEPMALVVTGNNPHRSLVLILHDAAVSDWTPKGLCQS